LQGTIKIEVFMSITYLNTKSKGITKTVAEFSKQENQSNREFREFIKEQVVEHRKEGIDVFKSPWPGDDRKKE
jgi:hypothetical protein